YKFCCAQFSAQFRRSVDAEAALLVHHLIRQDDGARFLSECLNNSSFYRFWKRNQRLWRDKHSVRIQRNRAGRVTLGDAITRVFNDPSLAIVNRHKRLALPKRT